jgi:hypothetical protein
MGVDFSYPRDPTLRQGQRQSALGDPGERRESGCPARPR